MGAMIIDPVSPEECGVLFSVLTASRTKQSAKHGKSTRFQIELISTPYHACGYYYLQLPEDVVLKSNLRPKIIFNVI